MHTLPCIHCDAPHLVAAQAAPAIATLGGVDVDVTVVRRVCEVTKLTFENTKDHDHRAEARAKLNARLGNPAGTRLPGVVVSLTGEMGSVPVPEYVQATQ
ncbi:hypothetical protein LCGC14_0113210 [marine sediment metagenome]|uniref:Uncharacterized protein n=2 Tax=root TaxID=1 RepID=A0A7V1BDY5_9RHOB|nr:hypothetical protein [Sulfitobacter litoralis]HDZ51413.1 hypothetical protein [Sulfitobacter litoralis]